MLLELKSIRLRFVEESDAKFILSLRLDEKYNELSFMQSLEASLRKTNTRLMIPKFWMRLRIIPPEESI